MANEDDQALGYPDYWDKHYSKSDGEAPTHEWFRSFSELEPFFRNNLFGLQSFKAEDNPLILHLGSGDSVCRRQSQTSRPTANQSSAQVIPAELAFRGYRRQLCIDFSTVVVQFMAERHSKVEGIEWKHMDLRNMIDVPDKSIDVAFDKATLDAMIHGSPWSPPREVKENTSKYLKEVGLSPPRNIADQVLLTTLQGPPSTEGSWDVSIRHVQTTPLHKATVKPR